MSSSEAGLGRYVRELRSGVALILVGAMAGVGCFALFFNHPAAKPEVAVERASHGFLTCREALQAGFSNIKRGEPGYRAELDADNDGLACEPYTPSAH